jgi:hypothetical protein
MKDRWWLRTPRHPGLVLAMAMLTALVVSAGITMVLTAGGGAHRPLAAGAGLGAAIPAPPSSTSTSPAPSPARTAPASISPAPSPARTTPAHPAPSAPAGKSGPASPPGKRTPPAAPTTSASPSASSSPAQGYLLVAPGQLVLTSKAGHPASGFFVLTAANGPVAQYTVRVTAKAGKVSVAPASGSLATNGFVEVTVTVTSKIALTTQIVAEPGDLSVTVVYQPKPKPTPAPGGGGGGG